MELDELKDIWKKNDPGFRPKDETEIATMLKGNSKSIIAKLKRSVWFELVFTTIAGIAMLIYAFTLPSGAWKWISISLLVLYIGYTLYYINKLVLLHKFSSAHDNVRANLEKLIDSLSNYLRFYKRSYAILYPVYFFVALTFIAIERGLDEFMHTLSQPRTIAYLVGIGALFFFCSTWLVTWLLKKLYGNHLEKLKNLLKDITTQPV